MSTYTIDFQPQSRAFLVRKDGRDFYYLLFDHADSGPSLGALLEAVESAAVEPIKAAALGLLDAIEHGWESGEVYHHSRELRYVLGGTVVLSDETIDAIREAVKRGSTIPGGDVLALVEEVERGRRGA